MRMISEGNKRFPIFERKDGSWSRSPPTLEEALTYNQGIYDPFPPEKCHCGRSSLKFADKSVSGNYCCTIEEAITTYNNSISGVPHSAAEAKLIGMDYFFTHRSCETCGGLNKRALNGKCYFCCRKLSPRKAAMAEGAAWYLPTEPCKTCGKIAEKRVNNGECRGCTEKCAVPKDLQPYREWPDMVISRVDAITAGWKTYRTGKPCKNGHTGWRWVSIRSCLTCMGRD